MQCPRRRLEDGFCNMVLVPTIQVFHVKVKPPFLYERLQEFFHQFRLQITDPRCLELHFVDKVWPAGQINNHPGQSFIQRNVCMSKATDPTPVPLTWAGVPLTWAEGPPPSSRGR